MTGTSRNSRAPQHARPAVADGFVRGFRSDRSLASHTAILLAGAFVVSLLAVSLLGENGLGAWFRLRGERQDLRQDVADLEAGNADLGVRLEKIEQDPEYFEKYVREEINGQKKGEEVLLILPAPEARNGVENGGD